MFLKNTAGQFIHVQGVDASTGGIKSGVTWTVRRCLDGTFAAAGGTATEDSTNGWYKFALSQADTNGFDCGFNFTGTGAVPQTVNFTTELATAQGYAAIDWNAINAPTTSVNLSGTTISGINNAAIKKNTALNNFPFLMTDSTTHAPKTGLTVAVTRSIDGGAFGAGTLSAVTEVGNGIYVVNFGTGDLNGKTITLRATATAADDLDVTLITDS